MAADEQTAALIAVVKQYYPTWDPDRESEDAFYERWYDAPEIARFKALIQDRVQQEAFTWPAFLDDVKKTLGPEFTVFNGTPPMFYIPSFQVVIWRKYSDHTVTMVFRLSMMAPLYDYYEHLRTPAGRWLQTNLQPGRDTADIARQVRSVITKHFPEYRELAPEIGAVRLHNMKTDNGFVNTATLADALFEDDRRW